MTASQQQGQESLQRAVTGMSERNYQAIFEGFMAKGIAQEDIAPRENVFTFNAWKALGRVVKKGEKGVKCVTFIPMSKENDDGEVESFSRPKTTTVFHISQTKEMFAICVECEEEYPATGRYLSVSGHAICPDCDKRLNGDK